MIKTLARVIWVLAIVALVLAVFAALSGCSGDAAGRTPSPRPNAAAAAVSDSTDRLYLTTLHSSRLDLGAHYGDKELAASGHAVCEGLGQGYGVVALAAALAEKGQMPLGTAAYMVGAAVGAFCPQYGSDLL